MERKRVLPSIIGLLLICCMLAGCDATATDKGSKVPITTTSDEARALFLKGRDLQEKLRIQESRKPLAKAVTADPDFAMAYLNLATAQPTAKQFFGVLEKATTLVDRVSEGERHWILGFEAGVNGQPMKQREHYQKLVELHPNDERAQTLLGNHYFGQQMYGEAIQYYETAIDINPEFSQPYNQLGYAYRFLERYDEAEKTFKKYIEVIPDDPNPYDSYAELLLKIGKFDGAIENYRKALEVNPNFPASYIGIATSYNLKGEHARARQQLDKFHEMARDDGQRRAALFATMVSYVDEGDMENALATAREMYAIAEKIDDAANMAGDLGNMGTILLEFGKPDAALDKFNKSIGIIRASRLSEAQKELAEQGHRFNLTRVALAKDDMMTAKQHAAEYRKKAQAHNNNFQIWNAHQLAGMIALAEKDFDTAVRELEQSNLQNPYNLYRLAQAHKGRGNTEQSKKILKQAKSYNALNSLQYAFMRNQLHDMM